MRELKFREIKFRAFDTENKTWTFVTLGDLVCGACTNHGDKPLSGAIQIWYEYTGLKDKNGKEIYEGDVVEYIWDFCGEKRKNNYVVEWLSGKVEHYPYSVDSGFTLPDSVDGYYEVIGNIHENPELLDKEEE